MTVKHLGQKVAISSPQSIFFVLGMKEIKMERTNTIPFLMKLLVEYNHSQPSFLPNTFGEYSITSSVPGAHGMCFSAQNTLMVD